MAENWQAGQSLVGLRMYASRGGFDGARFKGFLNVVNFCTFFEIKGTQIELFTFFIFLSFFIDANPTVVF